MTKLISLQQGVDYDFISHTADVGITVNARTLAETYEKCALVLFDLLFECASLEGKTREDQRLRIRADDREMLLVDFLNELVYLFFTRHFVVDEAEVCLEGNDLRAVLKGVFVSKEKFKVKEEIKAATYHQISIKETSPYHCEARVIFDV